ncbi:hypothetical protein HNP48_004693 [Acidovorax soli]|uniref:Uncharacterized protein n=1 Tax=Acidovorax soli TaxID=592050 RepID=A0A7X0UB55_9BURK|nr:hypothetical protein [Acidovorax soli]MBB6561991.1 hypothetical protein [Acidovorax soli]
MTTKTTAKTYPPSPLRPFVDAGVPAEILLEAHRVQQRPAMIRSIALVVTAFGSALGIAAYIYDSHNTRARSQTPASHQVVQAEDAQKSLPMPQKAP